MQELKEFISEIKMQIKEDPKEFILSFLFCSSAMFLCYIFLVIFGE